MRSLFIITSATNTRFGVYSTTQRLQQTLGTFDSISRELPDAKTLLAEMGGISLTQEQIDIYQTRADYFLNFSNTQQVKSIYNQTDNWDIVKNVTEVMMFGEALNILVSKNVSRQYDRIFKISGRYQLTDKFNPEIYLKNSEKIIIGKNHASQFLPQITGGLSKQYMSRLWSWPAILSPLILDIYKNGLDAMIKTINMGGYFDVEHMLYKYLPSDLVTEVEQIGVRGNLGPNGVAIED